MSIYAAHDKVVNTIKEFNIMLMNITDFVKILRDVEIFDSHAIWSTTFSFMATPMTMKITATLG